MRLVIAGGGTGGHTSAGLAVAAALQQREIECHWIGSRAGIEARRVPESGLPYHAIPTGKLRRYWDWQNFPDLLLRAPAGGVPGLANRIAGRMAQKIALTFPQMGTEFPPEKIVVTGNPLRPQLQGGSREAGLASLGLDPALPVIYLTGGAQGPHPINRAVGETLAPLLETCQVIHQCGDNPETGDRPWLEKQARDLPAGLRTRYHLIPYVGAELRDVYAVANLVVGRAGAGTVSECCHLGLPALYIPLPGTSGDEQTANARLVQAAGGAVLFPQIALTPRSLLESVRGLLADPSRLKAMGERARSLAVPDAADRIVRLILEAASP